MTRRCSGVCTSVSIDECNNQKDDELSHSTLYSDLENTLKSLLAIQQSDLPSIRLQGAAVARSDMVNNDDAILLPCDIDVIPTIVQCPESYFLRTLFPLRLIVRAVV